MSDESGKHNPFKMWLVGVEGCGAKADLLEEEQEKLRELLNIRCATKFPLFVNRWLQHRVVTGDGKWIHYSNPKRRKSWGLLGNASTLSARPNIHAAKVILCNGETRSVFFIMSC